MARAMRACGERNPNAIRVSRRILVLVDSIRPCPDNRLAEKGWTTRKNTHGHTEWLPPPHLDHGQPRTNTFHHPERFLHNQDDDDKPD